MTELELSAEIILTRNYLTMLEAAYLEIVFENRIKQEQRESDLDALGNWLEKTNLYEEYEFNDEQDQGEYE